MNIITFGKTARDRSAELEGPKVGLEGWVTVQLGRNLQAGHPNPIILRELHFRNVIVDAGLDYWLGTSITLGTVLGYFGVGTDSTAPTTSDTSLGAELGRTNSNGGFADATADGPSFSYREFQRTRLFLEGEVNGNLTEFGIFRNSVSTPMWCRQLLKDGGGTPTTIVKTASDQLRIIYTLRVYPPSSDVTSTISISAVNYDYTHRAANIGQNQWSFGAGAGSLLSAVMFGSTIASQAGAYETQTLGATSSNPAGTRTSASSVANAAYSNGTFYRDVTHVWEPAVANYTNGIGATDFQISGGSGAQFQTSWDPEFSKDNTKRLTLITRVTFTRL